MSVDVTNGKMIRAVVVDVMGGPTIGIVVEIDDGVVIGVGGATNVVVVLVNSVIGEESITSVEVGRDS